MELMSNREERERLGQNALAALESQRGATARTVNALVPLLSKGPASNPLTGLYGAAVALRNGLFDRGILPPGGWKQPVVSVGDLAAGGAGKTPFVIALGELLQERSIPFGRALPRIVAGDRGVLVVDPEGAAADFGDEPLLIARRLASRSSSARAVTRPAGSPSRSSGSQLHIFDDGFQHGSLHRDFDSGVDGGRSS